MGKKNKFKHEMFKNTAMHTSWHRLIQGGLDAHRSKVHLPEDALFMEVKNSLSEVWNPKKHDAKQFYRVMDAWMAAALMEVPARTNNLVNLIKSIVVSFGTPGFTDPSGHTYQEEFQNFMEGHTWLVRDLVDWNTHGQFVYTVAPTLSKMLLQTQLGNLPCQHLKLPSPSIYVCPPSGTWDVLSVEDDRLETVWNAKESTETEGVLVRELVPETKAEGYPVIGFMALRVVEARTGSSVASNTLFKVRLKPDTTLLDAIEQTLTDPKLNINVEDNHRTIRSIVEYTASVLVYATSQDADVKLARESPEYSKWIRELSRYPSGHKKRKPLLEQIDRADRSTIYHLGKSVVINRHVAKEASAKSEGTHASPVTHYRQGHFRSQRYGPRNHPQYKTIWIKPIIVGLGTPANTRQRHLK